MKCPNCPTNVKRRQNFCPNCGTRITQAAQAAGVDRAEDMLRKAKVAQVRGDYTWARDLARQAVNMNPNDASGHLLLAEVEVELKHPEQALDHARQAAALRPRLDRARMLVAGLEKQVSKRAAPQPVAPPGEPIGQPPVQQPAAAMPVEPVRPAPAEIDATIVQSASALAHWLEEWHKANKLVADLEERRAEIPAERYDSLRAEYEGAARRATEQIEQVRRQIHDELDILTRLVEANSADDIARLVPGVVSAAAAACAPTNPPAYPVSTAQPPMQEPPAFAAAAQSIFINRWIGLIASAVILIAELISMVQLGVSNLAESGLIVIVFLYMALAVASAVVSLHRFKKARAALHITLGGITTLLILSFIIAAQAGILNAALLAFLLEIQKPILYTQLVMGIALVVGGIREAREAAPPAGVSVGLTIAPHAGVPTEAQVPGGVQPTWPALGGMAAGKLISVPWRKIPARVRALVIAVPILAVALCIGYYLWSQRSQVQVDLGPVSAPTESLFGTRIETSSEVTVRNTGQREITVGRRESQAATEAAEKAGQLLFGKGGGGKPTPDTTYFVETEVHNSHRNTWEKNRFGALETPEGSFGGSRSIAPGGEVKFRVAVFGGSPDQFKNMQLDQVRVVVQNQAGWDRVEKTVSIPSEAAKRQAAEHIARAKQCRDANPPDRRSEYNEIGEALRQYPNSVEAHFMLAWNHMSFGRRDAAMQEFETVKGLAPPGSREHEEALKMLQQKAGAQLRPRTGGPQPLGIAAARRSAPPRPAVRVRRVRTAPVVSPPVNAATRQAALAYVQKAAECRARHDVRGAYGNLTNALSRDPSCMKAHLMLAELHQSTGARAAAIRECEIIVSISPNSPEAAQARRGLARLKR